MSSEPRTKVVPSNRVAFLGPLLFALSLALAGPAAGQSTEFVYAVYSVYCGACDGRSPGYISAHLANQTTGALTEVFGSPYAAGLTPLAIAAKPSGTAVYVVSQDSDVDPNRDRGILTAYTTLSSGGLSQNGNGVVLDGSGFPAIAVHPSGQYVYVANDGTGSGHQISVFALNSTDYPETLIGSFPTGFNPSSMAVHPNGQYLYVANLGDANVSEYSIDANGLLAPLSGSPIQVGPDNRVIAVNPSGSFAYVLHTGSDVLSAWAISATTGQLNPSPNYVRTGSSPISLTVTLDPMFGQQLTYVANWTSSDISAFRGAFTPVVGSPFRIYPASTPAAVTADPTGRFLYVLSLYRQLSAYTINGSTGVLTEIEGSPYSTGGVHPQAIAAVAVPIPGEGR